MIILCMIFFRILFNKIFLNPKVLDAKESDDVKMNLRSIMSVLYVIIMDYLKSIVPTVPNN